MRGNNYKVSSKHDEAMMHKAIDKICKGEFTKDNVDKLNSIISYMGIKIKPINK